MDIWRVVSNTVTGGHTHDLGGHPAHALLSPLVGAVFQELAVSASVNDGSFWWSIRAEPDLVPFEVAHGVEPRRWAHNERRIAEAREQKRAVRGEHAGYSDLFVPILLAGKVAAVLVAGPFATKRPTSADVLSRWRSISGQQGQMTDVEFAAYVRASLATLVLEGPQLGAFERLVGRLADLMGGAGKAEAVMNQAGELRLEVRAARAAERMWASAREMINESSAKIQFSAASADRLSRLGLLRAADQVLVGLIASPASPLDPVDELVRADGLQRAAAEFALAEGGVISGRFGDRGVTFLFGAETSAQRRKKRAAHVAERVAALGRRGFGLSLHFGTSLATGSPLARSYQVALAAAELALSRGERLLFSENLPERPARSLRVLRAELCRLAEERPERLAAEFDRYLEQVAAHAGYRVEPARTQLEVCFERIADQLLGSGAIESKAFERMQEYLEHVARDAPTLSDLFAAYRRTLLDLAEAVRRPIPARQDRGLRSAIEYIHRHYSEDVNIRKVASIAGFAPTYFSELFKKHEGTTFEKYVFKLRLERAKQLLTGTDLSVKRIAELSGYASPEYLSRVFRRVIGRTPIEYRKRLVPEWFRKGRKSAAKRARKKGAV